MCDLSYVIKKKLLPRVGVPPVGRMSGHLRCNDVSLK